MNHPNIYVPAFLGSLSGRPGTQVHDSSSAVEQACRQEGQQRWKVWAQASLTSASRFLAQGLRFRVSG